ncbi:MAG: glycosyltransferase [Candidatus Syntrophosphaera sp.]
MKVLHVDPELTWRGGQQQAVYLYEGMLKQGLDCGFVCRPGSCLRDHFQRESLAHHTINFRGEADILSGLKLALCAKRGGYGILYLHSAHALGWGWLARLFCPTLKLIAARRVDFPIRKNLFSRIKYHSADRVVAISGNIRRVLISDGIDPGKIRVIHSGIDPHKFRNVKPDKDLRKRWGIPGDAILVGTIAALAGHKDYPNLLRAAAMAVKSSSGLYFMAVGGGKLMAGLKALSHELGLDGRFVFTGQQKDVGQFLKSFDIFVLASKKEGLGTSVLDAMSVGLPVIGTTAGGIGEMIGDGASGLLVPPSDPKALADSIVKLAGDAGLRANLGQAALAKVRDFDRRIMVQKNLEMLGEF